MTFFAHLRMQLNENNERGRRPYTTWVRMLDAEPCDALERFRSAVSRVLAVGFPDYQGLTSWGSLEAAPHLRAPRSLGLPNEAHRFPHRMPFHLLTPFMADVMYDGYDLDDVREVASMGALMSGTGLSLAECADLFPRTAVHDRWKLPNFIQRLVAAERRGQAEAFWEDSLETAANLIDEGEDYRLRESLVERRDFREQLHTRLPGVSNDLLEYWLDDRWACAATVYVRSFQVYPQLYFRPPHPLEIEAIENDYGDRLRDMLEDALREGAA